MPSIIDTREELIDALTEAAELEHGLLLQYLFAAFSLKRRTDEGIDEVERALMGDWERAILRVSQDEMRHLGLVCNLLSAIGGSPRFGRPNFPQPIDKYYPFDFSLEPFSDRTMYRFIWFELPKGEPPPKPPENMLWSNRAMDLFAEGVVPDKLEYKHVGELYKQIRDGIGKIPEKELFIGPITAQDEQEWSIDLRLIAVRNRKTAEAAIDAIVEDGEGAQAKREGSHYDTFLKVREALAKHPELEAARPVVRNPMTREHRDAKGTVTLIKNEQTRQVAELFNGAYAIVLLMLSQYYSHGGETPTQRKGLRDLLGQMMSTLIRPIGEVLTELPAVSKDPKDGVAGPCFELYGDLRIAPTVQNRWVVLTERLRALHEAAVELSKQKAHPRLALTTQHLAWLRDRLQTVAGEG